MISSFGRLGVFAGFLVCAVGAGPLWAVVVQAEHFKFIGPRSATDPTNNYQFDVNADGVDDVAMSFSALLHAGMMFGPSDSGAGGRNGAEIATGPTGGSPPIQVVTRFGPGEVIGPGTFFSAGGPLTMQPTMGTTGKWGSENGPHFMGVRFPVGGQTHYGWVELTHDPAPGLMSPSGFPSIGPLIIRSVAYETSPNTAITTVPEPAAGAAVGCLVALAWAGRRRVSAVR